MKKILITLSLLYVAAAQAGEHIVDCSKINTSMSLKTAKTTCAYKDAAKLVEEHKIKDRAKSKLSAYLKSKIGG